MDSNTIITETEIHIVSVGEQGPPGAPGKDGLGGGVAIDDATISLLSTFSSQHITELITPFSISSFSLSQTTAEMGATVTSEHLSWASNYPPDSISLNNGIGALTPPLSSYDHIGQAITTNRTYTLTLIKNGVQKTSNASLSFLNQYYYGVNAAQIIDAATIKSMTHALFASRARTLNFDCTGGRFFHLAYPSRLGAATFSINSLTYSDVTMTVVPITNASGFTENYNVYYCNVIQNGASIPLVVL